MKSLRYISIDTNSVGEFHLIIDSDDYLVASGFGGIEKLITRLPSSITLAGFELSRVLGHAYEVLVKEYFSGKKVDLGMILKRQEATGFASDVLNEVGKIKYGETKSYKQIAEQLDNPGSVRAIGTICGSNRNILIVPCHRVIKSDGSIGEYVYGAKVKQFLLELESVSSL